MIYLIPEYINYSYVNISCDLDVYELGFLTGRGGIHNFNLLNLFSGREWLPENGIYVAESLLEEVVKELKIKDSEVIRLYEKTIYSRSERRELVKKHKEEKSMWSPISPSLSTNQL